MLEAFNISGPGKVIVGARCRIAPDVQFIFHSPSTIEFGDYCVVGSGVRFVCDGGDITVGDWTTIHDRSLVLSSLGVSIGQHGWFGQNCILDGTGGLSIGRSVRVGMYSQIWSHVAAGEQIEGCTLYGERPVVLEDEVWLVGSCIVASGVTLGRRTIALIASNITRSWPQNSVLAGSPAALKEKLSFYKEISPEERWALLSAWLDEAAGTFDLDIVVRTERMIVLRDAHKKQYISFLESESCSASLAAEFLVGTVCYLDTKNYTKRLTDIEGSVLKFLAGNKARFYQNIEGVILK